ncbi:tetratricopeptide repeat protein [Methylocystis parvus]|uniref:tetratricopeptide repeat protein n=1 Tax=Methylocystis parvus TaxID=134 RepID=UPI003C7226C3
MGAKVAALPSNRHGLRYRSCLDGVVSEITLGERDGVYGRLAAGRHRDGTAYEVADVTQSVNEYDRRRDWTEVQLLGNRPDQDTRLQPYDDDPSVPEDWLEAQLSQRFFRLPSAIKLFVADLDGVWRVFTPIAAQTKKFDRWESVLAAHGIIVHFGFSANASVNKDFAGSGAIVYHDEIYGRRAEQDWLMDAPNFGFPFGAAHFSVLVELPNDFGVLPEVYRQFLRFRSGDQRQVFLNDFAPIVRDAMPQWLKELIKTFGPAQVDLTQEVESELAELLEQLGVRAISRSTSNIRGTKAAEKKGESGERAQPKVRFEKSPEIIALNTPEQIAERNLEGRVARYYPATHQLFINLTYSAIQSLAAQLEQDFAHAPDPDLCRIAARDLAEWATMRSAGRAIAYGLSKKALGWTPEEISKVQSPEALSLIADDYSALLPMLRRRIAERLGLSDPEAYEHLGGTRRLSPDVRLAIESAEAQQAIRHALATKQVNVAPIMRRVSAIEVQRGNYDAALDWAQQAVSNDATDCACHVQLAGVHILREELEEAEAALAKGMELAENDAAVASCLRHQANLERARGNLAQAIEKVRDAIKVAPMDAGPVVQLASFLLQSGDLDAAGAACDQALGLSPDRPAPILRLAATVKNRMGDFAAAVALLQKSVEAEPHEWRPHLELSLNLVKSGNLFEAERASLKALELTPDDRGPVLRLLGSIERARQNSKGALHWITQALEVDENDVFALDQLCAIKLMENELEEAERAAKRHLELTRDKPGRALRQLSLVEKHKGSTTSAIKLAKKAIEADAENAEGYTILGGVLMQASEWDAAAAAMRCALERTTTNPARLFRQLSIIEQRRKNLDLAIEFAEKAVEADPDDALAHNHLSGLLFQNSNLDGAELAARKALEISNSRPGG